LLTQRHGAREKKKKKKKKKRVNILKSWHELTETQNGYDQVYSKWISLVLFGFYYHLASPRAVLGGQSVWYL
jgi:hypothetical protein